MSTAIAPQGGAPLALRSRSFVPDRVAWAVFVVSLGLALLGMHAWLHRKVPLYDASAPPRTTHEFRLPVLVWDRIAEGTGGRHTDAALVEEQLLAIRAAGYQPVTLRQVRDAYRSGAPLPERPILLTFDGGHLTTYRTVDPILRKLRWPAVMFLDTSAQPARHPTYVYWDGVQRMADSGLWQFGVLGSWPESAWLVEANLRNVEVLAAASRSTTAFGDPRVATPPLGFGNSLFGVNDPHTNPAQLARLHVSRGWSAKALVARLDAAVTPPASGPRGELTAIAPDRWVTTAGRSDLSDGVLTLTGDPRAEAWLSGAEWARDFTLEAEVRFERGSFWITQQGIEWSRQWRWGGSERTVYLERLRPRQRADIISRVETTPRPGAWHSLRLTKRGSGVWVEWDGEPLPGMPHRIPEQPRNHLAFSTGSLSAPGTVSLRKVRFAELPYRVAPVSGSPSREEIQTVLRHRSRVAALSPPAFVQEGAGYVRVPMDAELMSMLTARGAWELCPTVRLAPDDPRGADVARAAELADLALREGWSGLRIEGQTLTVPVVSAWRTAAASWERAFTGRGLRLVLELPES